MWKTHVDPKLIDMFLDKIFQKVGRSFFDMEKIMKDYIYGEAIFFYNRTELEDEFTEMCSDCDIVNELDNDIYILGEERSELESKISDLKHKLEEMEIEYDRRIEQIKKDCIVFKI